MALVGFIAYLGMASFVAFAIIALPWFIATRAASRAKLVAMVWALRFGVFLFYACLYAAAFESLDRARLGTSAPFYLAAAAVVLLCLGLSSSSQSLAEAGRQGDEQQFREVSLDGVWALISVASFLALAVGFPRPASLVAGWSLRLTRWLVEVPLLGTLLYWVGGLFLLFLLSGTVRVLLGGTVLALFGLRRLHADNGE